MNTLLKIVIFLITIGLFTVSIYTLQIENTKVANNSFFNINTLINKQITQLQKNYIGVAFNHVNGDILVTLDENVICFDLNSTSLNDSAKRKLLPLSNILTRENIVKITGYTCNFGFDEYNLQLSLHRAESVKNFIQSINPNLINIQTFGLGSHNPIADNSTAIGRKRNRRVEIKIENVNFNDSKIGDKSQLSSNDQNDKVIDLITKYNKIIILLSLLAAVIQIIDFVKKIFN